MKVKIIRESGLPVDKCHSYMSEWKVRYDEINSLFTNKKIEMKEFQEKLNSLDSELLKKYDGDSLLIELPKNNKQWIELQKKYEMPIVVSRDYNDKCILVLMDIGQ